MRYTTSQEDIENYYSSPALNQSLLKSLSNLEEFNKINSLSTNKDKELYYSEKDYFIIGGAVDVKLTGHLEQYGNSYHISNVPKPAEKIMSMVNQIFDTQSKLISETDFFPEDLNELSDEMIQHAIESHGYYTNRKMSTNIENVRLEGNDYYKDLVMARGKTVLSPQQDKIIGAITNSLVSCEAIAPFFLPHSVNTTFDIYTQLPIYFEFRGIDCKALLDIVKVDHMHKTICVIDLKTLYGPTIDFLDTLKLRRYDIQGAWYTIAVENWRKSRPELVDYVVINPMFIVETTAEDRQGNPLLVECDNQVMHVALHGLDIYSSVNMYQEAPQLPDEKHFLLNRKVLGINELLDKYVWHTENGFGTERLIAEGKNKLKLSWEAMYNENTIG